MMTISRRSIFINLWAHEIPSIVHSTDLSAHMASGSPAIWFYGYSLFWHRIRSILTAENRCPPRIDERECGNKFQSIWLWWAHHDWTKYSTLLLAILGENMETVRVDPNDGISHAHFVGTKNDRFIIIWFYEVMAAVSSFSRFFRMESWCVHGVNDFRIYGVRFKINSCLRCCILCAK